jgi:alpha-L-fucosidase
LRTPTQLNAVIAMEDIAQGERVREWVVEVRVRSGAWEKLGEGQSIGHKRILSFPRQELAAVRLRITKAIAAPQLRRLAVFDTAS